MVRQKYLQRICHDTIFTISHDTIPYQITIFFSIDDSKREVLRNRGCSKKRKQENKNPLYREFFSCDEKGLIA